MRVAWRRAMMRYYQQLSTLLPSALPSSPLAHSLFNCRAWTVRRAAHSPTTSIQHPLTSNVCGQRCCCLHNKVCERSTRCTKVGYPTSWLTVPSTRPLSTATTRPLSVSVSMSLPIHPTAARRKTHGRSFNSMSTQPFCSARARERISSLNRQSSTSVV